jgi:hypothetical protein
MNQVSVFGLLSVVMGWAVIMDPTVPVPVLMMMMNMAGKRLASPVKK